MNSDAAGFESAGAGAGVKSDAAGLAAGAAPKREAGLAAAGAAPKSVPPFAVSGVAAAGAVPKLKVARIPGDHPSPWRQTST